MKTNGIVDALVHTTGGMAVFDHWQTLVGAAFGGILAVIAALIVAHMAARREQRITGSLLLPEVQQLTAAAQGLARKVQDGATIDEAARHQAMCLLLLAERPHVSALYTPTMGQVSDVDARLYSHLFQCQMTHRSFEVALVAFAESDRVVSAKRHAIAKAARTGALVRPEIEEEHAHAEAKAAFDARRAVRAWAYCTEHAELASYFLDRLVFNVWARPLARLRMRCWPNDYDRRSARFLKIGVLPGEGITP